MVVDVIKQTIAVLTGKKKKKRLGFIMGEIYELEIW